MQRGRCRATRQPPAALRLLRAEALEERTLLTATPDLNQNGRVDLLDLEVLGRQWGDGASAADLTGDGRVGLADVNALGGQWSAGNRLLADSASPSVRFRLDSSATDSVLRDGTVSLSAATEQYLSTPDDASLDLTTRMTVAFWVNQTTLALDRGIVSKWNFPSDGSWAINTGGTGGEEGDLRVWIATGNPAQPMALGTTVRANMLPGVWYHVAVVYDGTQTDNAGRLNVYIDGRRQDLVYTDSRPGSPSADINGDGIVNFVDLNLLGSNWQGSGVGDVDGNGIVNMTDVMILGAQWLQPPPLPPSPGTAIPTSLVASSADVEIGRIAGLGRYLDGSLDTVAIWARALSAAEVRDLFNAGQGKSHAQLAASERAGLAAWWDMEEATGAARADATGAGHTLHDATGAALRQIVAAWHDQGPEQTILSQPYRFRPDYAPAAINGQGAVRFDGVNDLLRGDIPAFAADSAGSVFLVVRFGDDTDFSRFNSIFSSADEDSSSRYFFFVTFPIDSETGQYSATGAPRFRIRWRQDALNADLRGHTIVQPNTTYVVNISSDGAGQGYHMRVNGVDQSFTTTSYQPAIFGSWYGDIAGLDNLTVGTLLRGDGAEDHGRQTLGEVLVLGPGVTLEDNRAIEQSLAAKWGVTLAGP